MIESNQVIGIHLLNADVDRTTVEKGSLYTLSSPDDPRYAQPINPKEVSFRSRLINVSLRRNTVEVGNHVFLLFDQPLQQGKRYVLEVDSAFPVAFEPVPIVFDAHRNVSENIRVNQVGYLLGRPKYAMVGQYIGTLGPLPFELDTFFLVDAATGDKVYQGRAELIQSYDVHTGQKVYRLDFSEFDRPGTYHVFVPQIGVSFDFRIAADVFNHVGTALMHGLVTQRSCYDGLTPDFTRFHRPASHCDDAYLDIASLEVVQPSHPPHLMADYENRTFMDTTRGHHDAGDYGKYVYNGANFVHVLLEMLSLSSNLASDDLGLPFSNNGIPDVIEEVKWELDWLEKMQDPDDGGVFSIVKPARTFGYETDMPAIEGGRWIYPKDTVTTAAFAAALAHAARHPLIQQFYPEAAKRYLQKAEFAWTFLEEHSHSPAFHHYGQIWGDLDDRVWAAVELYMATGDEKYHAYFLAHHQPEEKRWSWVDLFASYGNATRTYVLDATREKDPDMLQRCLDALESAAETHVRFASQRSYGFSMHDEPLRHANCSYHFPTADHAYDLIVAYEVFGDLRYLEAALANMNYELGVNAQSYVQITGIGYKRVMDLVDQQHRYRGILEPRIGIPLGAGTSGIYQVYGLGDLNAHTYPEDYPLLARFYEGWNVHSEVTIDLWGRIAAVYLYFFQEQDEPNIPPEIEVVYTLDPDDPQAVTFQAKVHDKDGEVVSVFWDFDDEAWAVGEKVSHRFSRLGREYRVFVRATDNGGKIAERYVVIGLFGTKS